MDSSGIVTVLESKAQVYATVNGSKTGQTLAFDTQWKYNNTSTDDQSRNWFHVGGGQWVCETEVGVKIQSATHTKGVLSSSGAFVRISPNGSGAGFNLGANEPYSYDTKVVDAWGYTWYHVGYANWVAGLDITLKTSGVVTVLESKAQVYATVNGSLTGQTLAFNTQWKYNSTAVDKQGRNWYHVGGGQWVCETEVGDQIQSATHVKGTLNSNGALVRFAPNGSSSGHNLTVGLAYKYDTRVVDNWNYSWYHVGYANWVAGLDVTVSGSGSEIVNIAESMLGYFTYSQVHGVSYIGSVANPNRYGQTDCSGFVWLVLKKAGCNVPDNMQWYTGSMESDARYNHNWLKQVSTSEAQPGDIIIMNSGSGAGNNGHTAILTSNWNGNATSIIEMGGNPNANGVNTWTVGNAFYSLLNAGASQVLARPI